MELSRQVTSLEISERLKELGVPQQSLWTWCEGGIIPTNEANELVENGEVPAFILFSAFTCSELIELIEQSANEWACGYNDSGCYYHFRKGNRGTGNMIEGFGGKSVFSAEPEDDPFINALGRWVIYLLENNLIKPQAGGR